MEKTQTKTLQTSKPEIKLVSVDDKDPDSPEIEYKIEGCLDEVFWSIGTAYPKVKTTDTSSGKHLFTITDLSLCPPEKNELEIFGLRNGIVQAKASTPIDLSPVEQKEILEGTLRVDDDPPQCVPPILVKTAKKLFKIDLPIDVPLCSPLIDPSKHYFAEFRSTLRPNLFKWEWPGLPGSEKNGGKKFWDRFIGLRRTNLDVPVATLTVSFRNMEDIDGRTARNTPEAWLEFIKSNSDVSYPFNNAKVKSMKINTFLKMR